MQRTLCFRWLKVTVIRRPPGGLGVRVSATLQGNHCLISPPFPLLIKCSDTCKHKIGIKSLYSLTFRMKSSLWTIWMWQHAHSEPLVLLGVWIGCPPGGKWMLTVSISASRVCLCLPTICGAELRPNDPVAKLCLALPPSIAGAVFCSNAITCLWDLHLAARPGNNSPRNPLISNSRWFLDPPLTRQPLESLAACKRSSLPSYNNVTSISAPLLLLKCARKSIWILIVLWACLAVSLRRWAERLWPAEAAMKTSCLRRSHHPMMSRSQNKTASFCFCWDRLTKQSISHNPSSSQVFECAEGLW